MFSIFLEWSPIGPCRFSGPPFLPCGFAATVRRYPAGCPETAWPPLHMLVHCLSLSEVKLYNTCLNTILYHISINHHIHTYVIIHHTFVHWHYATTKHGRKRGYDHPLAIVLNRANCGQQGLQGKSDPKTPGSLATRLRKPKKTTESDSATTCPVVPLYQKWPDIFPLLEKFEKRKTPNPKNPDPSKVAFQLFWGPGLVRVNLRRIFPNQPSTVTCPADGRYINDFTPQACNLWVDNQRDPRSSEYCHEAPAAGVSRGIPWGFYKKPGSWKYGENMGKP